jgi:transcriptional regulator with XRE-family HTH domain
MTPAEFKAARKRLGLSVEEMAACLRLKGDRAVRRYEEGSREISGPITLCIDYLLKYGKLRR